MHDKLSKIMEIKSRFDHFNVNVTDLDRSLKFYAEALGLKEIGRKQAADGSFVLVYLGDGESPFRLELTWLRDHAAAQLARLIAEQSQLFFDKLNRLRQVRADLRRAVDRSPVLDDLVFHFDGFRQ